MENRPEQFSGMPTVLCSSSTVTFQPSFASKLATFKPAGPAPAISTASIVKFKREKD